MKKFLTKIKTVLTTLWIAIISFSSKVMGQVIEITEKRIDWGRETQVQYLYWVPSTRRYYGPSPSTPILNGIKLALTAAILIIWIINLIRIIRTDDKDLKKKRIKNTIIIIAILAAILAITFIISARLLKK